MKSDQDKGDSTYQELSGRVEQLSSKYQEVMAFFQPSLLKMDQEIINQWIKDEEGLNRFKRVLTQLFRYKKHTLSEKEEQLLSSFRPVFVASNKTASLLRNADMNLGKVHNEEGEEITLRESTYSSLIESKNRTMRKEAFDTLYQSYANFKNTFASTYEAQVKLSCTNAKIRGYDSSLQEALYDDNLDISVYHTLIDTIKKNFKPLYQYFALKKEVLHLDEFHLYDAYVPLIEGESRNYSFDDAKTLVLNALSILGEEYQEQLNQAFNNRWIDKYPNIGKRAGAYSWGCFDTLPYVLLNYNGGLDDVSTIAHELGHSMHSYYSRKYNTYEDHNYVIFTAEIASTVNELLFYQYMLKNSNSKQEKLEILSSMMDLFKSTIYRQTMFAEFEMFAHKSVSEGKVLTNDYLSDYYYQLNQEYFGPDVKVDEAIRYEWERIPHFYTPFYVYQYATGLSIASQIVKNINEQGSSYVTKYINFLKSGGRDYPMELLKTIDIDIKDAKYIESALALFQDVINQFNEVYHS